MKPLLFLLVLPWFILPSANAAETRLKLATTTSTENSGLLGALNPPFEKKYNAKVDVISVGTGKAIRLARNGDVDLILAHAPAAEEEFVRAGYGIERRPVMHNDFVLVGPASDPAGLRHAADIADAMARLLGGKHPFVSRGDDSGTHKKEKNLWPTTDRSPAGDWYLSVGQGMGVVLRIANDKQAYTLTDRGTWLAYRDKLSLAILFEGDAALFNPYHVILVNPARHPHAKVDLAKAYAAFIRGRQGQGIIGNFRVNGEILFHPDVIKAGSQGKDSLPTDL